MRPAHALAGIACLAIAAIAYAQSTPVAAPDNAPVQAAPLDEKPATWGDAKAGQAKAGVCAACHGMDGNAMQQNAPRIAGMPERYIAEQLELFKTGQRTSGLAGVMMPFASLLSAQDMRDVGAWFAEQKAGAGVADDTVIADGPNKGMKFYQVGERLFRDGDASRGIPACMACHGPAGSGNPGPAYPALHGQDATYVARRLEEYRAGTSSYKNPAHFQLMAMVSKPLTDEEIQSLASYVQGLHAR
ncbi:c-type cytochrome [Thermomonas haemolytica]|uniref:Cytochrome c553 n=1 Tax=Thermomonas haemolytica TaxID=141949 RepID=A0A4R3N5D4_9GAMM|nr:c-type cytochrome [Thermomonas haemolytica]TCT23491.1 cytochrome c553 [Thermomonas haemolytica]TNY28453.1 cytochrome C [Thermomonas haemolytica]